MTRTSILGHSHTKPKKVEADVGAVEPSTDDAVPREIVPAAAAYDAVITGSSTLLMSLPFFSQKIFEPLKRLLGAALTYFQTYTAPHNTFCRFGFAAYRHGWWWFQTVVSFSLEKLIVEQCTRTYTAQQPVAAQPHRQKRHGCRWFHATATFEASPQTRR
ncbi:hypothetical protein GWP43_07235 [Treponema vincentii]|uniref:Uncharacterized protein n=1 Tax=Treponema vincentii TaxID=69710 RepID=A0A6P1Y170_9SPIR|nr:hypothetical protein [Treponema vincentii]QHX43274.1 hypothetical protein GWP43_07235 [Treponema vincentii]